MSEIDPVLRAQMREVRGMVVQLADSMTVVGQQVAVVGQEQRETRGELATLRDDFLAYVRKAELTANVQRAETKIGVLEARLDNEFGHHKVVRLTAVGILQAFDVGLVSEDVIRTVSEQLMVQTPRYWLAPVLVALSAWAGGDRNLCDRAVTEAVRRSPARTSLFMALMLRRQGRRDSAVRWLRHYLAAQDPATLGREFAVVLECTAQGAFGPAAVALMREYLERWQDTLLGDGTRQAAQVQQWRREVDRYIGASSSADFPHLARVSPQWPALDRALSCASAHAALRDRYTAMFAEQDPPAERLEDAVDDILDRLVREYDTDELPLRRELAYHNTVVQQHGDIVAADAAVRLRTAALQSTLDYLSIQTQSALTPDDIGVSRSTQRIAVASCHEWLSRAHAEYTVDYRKALPPAVDAVFGGARNLAAQAFQLPEWTGSFIRPLPELEASLAGHWDAHARPYIDGFVAGWRTKFIMAGILAGVAVVVLIACLGFVAGSLVTLVGAGITATVLYLGYQAALTRQRTARDFIEQAKAESIRQLRAANAELVDWSTRFQQADAGETAVRAFLDTLSTAGHAGTPYERRAVALDRRES